MSKYQLISPESAAEMLGVKKSTIYAWVSQRKIPHLKIGHLIKFDVAQIESWISKCVVVRDARLLA
jgi:excisionase family DNA binding protein